MATVKPDKRKRTGRGCGVSLRQGGRRVHQEDLFHSMGKVLRVLGGRGEAHPPYQNRGYAFLPQHCNGGVGILCSEVLPGQVKGGWPDSNWGQVLKEFGGVE